MHITAIFGSPRKDGNTDLLLRALLDGARQQGAAVSEVFLRELHYSACIECGGCDETGVCVLRDDMDGLYELFATTDAVVLAAPVFFYGFNALTKAMIDRSQSMYIRKYVLKQSRAAARGTGILLSVGGSQGKKIFDGMLLTARYFFDALDLPFTEHLTYRDLGDCGAIRRHPTALQEAHNLGRTLCPAGP